MERSARRSAGRDTIGVPLPRPGGVTLRDSSCVRRRRPLAGNFPAARASPRVSCAHLAVTVVEQRPVEIIYQGGVKP